MDKETDFDMSLENKRTSLMATGGGILRFVFASCGVVLVLATLASLEMHIERSKVIRRESSRLSGLLSRHVSKNDILVSLTTKSAWTVTREKALAICGKYRGPKVHMEKVDQYPSAIIYFERDVVMVLFFGGDDVFVDFTYFLN